MPVIIPTTADVSRTFSFDSGTFLFGMKTYYNAKLNYWYCDISEAGVDLILGAGISANTNILSFSPNLTRKFGQFIPVNVNELTIPSPTSLGDTVEITYFEPGEFESTYPEYNNVLLQPLTYDFDLLFKVAP